jgi:hypothetical protein
MVLSSQVATPPGTPLVNVEPASYPHINHLDEEVTFSYAQLVVSRDGA